jgi:hypothetical protein
MLCLGGWILFTVLFTEFWYRSHETVGRDRWSFVWPVYKPDFADVPISKSEADTLLFDEGRGAEWTNEDGSHWVAYNFRWSQGPSRSRILARAHHPENCFPGPPEFQRERWWQSSERSREFLDEAVGYLYEILLNSGRRSNSPKQAAP